MTITVDLTADIWELRSLDVQTTDWSFTTLHFTEQTYRADGGVDLVGFFEWRDEFDRYGRESFTAEIDPDGAFRTLNTDLTAPTRGIITASYTATLSDDGQALLDGRWGAGVAGDFEARAELTAARRLFDLEGGATPDEGTPIALELVTIRGLDGGPLALAKTGGPEAAFGSAFGADTVRPDRADEIGAVFVTDVTGEGLRFTFDQAVSEVSGALLDVDGAEAWALTVRDANGTEIARTTISAGDPFTGDGMVSYWILQTDDGADAIREMEIAPLGSGDPLALDRLAFELTEGALPIRAVLSPQADRFTGDAADDTISGRGGADRISGAAGADQISGGRGADKIFGGTGRDTLIGGRGSDTLKGGAGADVLDGGKGRDVLTGGAGPDTFIYGGRGLDVITDFAPGQDMLRLEGLANIGGFRAFIDRTEEIGDDLIYTGGGTSLILEGLRLEDLSRGDLDLG